MNGDHAIPSSFKALIEDCALRATEEDIEGVPEWERFRVISHEAGLFLYILVFSTRRKKIIVLDGHGGAGSSIAWLAGAATEVGGEVRAFEINPRRRLKLQNILSKARLSPVVGVSGFDPLWEGGGGVIAPPETEDGSQVEDIVELEPGYDCVVVSLSDADWLQRISIGWDLLDEDGILVLTDTLQAPDSADDLIGEFFAARAASAVGIRIGEGLVIAYKLPSDSPEQAELVGDSALVDDRALEVLHELATENLKPGSRLWAIPPETGRFLWMLLRAMEASNVLEVGASSGYSGIWIASALGKTRGSLTTIEIDPEKVALATQSYNRAGVSDRVAILEGDAREILGLGSVRGPFDLIFLDCEKEHYLELAIDLVALLRPGGLLVSDNVISHSDELKNFVEEMQHHNNLASVTAGVGSGVEVTIRL